MISEEAKELQRTGMTIWTETFSAQDREDHIAFHIMDDCPRSHEYGMPAEIPYKDLLVLRDLMEAMEDRGNFDGIRTDS